MTNKRLLQDIAKKFQELHGNMSFYCFDKKTALGTVIDIINRFRLARPDSKILIIIDTYNDRVDIKNLMDSVGLDYNDFTIITKNYINPRFHYVYDLCIFYGVDDINIIIKIKSECKFGLVILKNHIYDNNKIISIRSRYKDAGIIVPKDFNRIFPVKGYVHYVSMSADDKELYNNYTEYINDSIKIFGDIDTINNCRIGSNNKSSAEYREELATLNGWSNTMDTSLEFYKAIDDMYNPNALYERACNFFSIANKRRKLITDNVAKLNKLVNLVINMVDKGEKVVVVNKTDEFANLVTSTLKYNEIDCGDYHDEIPDKLATTLYGEPILVKSGVNKGKQKVLKSQAISSLSEEQFNNNIINVLSIKSSSNSKLKIACDTIIFTTTLCPNINDFMARFENVEVTKTPIEIHYIICDEIIEENALIDIIKLKNVEIEKVNAKNAKLSENNLDIIL